uniref:Uncharacterized protein n=1 Tax=Arundo donax TaxID=35708 RepID=A0A0A9GTX6_ARUDO
MSQAKSGVPGSRHNKRSLQDIALLWKQYYHNQDWWPGLAQISKRKMV